MSWKSLVTAGLLCVLASPVFADPTMNMVKGGTFGNNNLDAAGNWVWNVTITPDLTLMPSGDTSGTPMAAELGFTSTNRDVIAAARLNQSTNFDTINPGSIVFSTWQNTTNGLLDANSNNRPTGLQLNGPGIGATAGSSYTTNSSVSGTLNQVFAALGSVNFTTTTAKDYIQITVKRPIDDAAPTPGGLNSSVQVSGVYGTGTQGRLTQINGGTNGGPYTTGNFNVGSLFQRAVIRGDVTMDGFAKDEDLAQILNLFGGSGRTWYNGDLNGDGIAKDEDLALLLSNFNGTGGIGLGGGGGGGLSSNGGSVPEPASIALMGLALLGGLGIFRRKR